MKANKAMIAAGVIGVLALTACNNGSAVSAAGTYPGTVQVQNTDSQVITVNARAGVKVTPDMTQVIYGVKTQDKDASVCQAENAEKVNQVIELLKEMGIGEKSIQTSNYDLYPQQDWENDGRITGYVMAAQITVNDIPLEQVGEILTKSVEAGVNEVQSVTYLSSKYTESYQEALSMSVAAAREKAQILAEASGNKLGRAVKITEYGENQTARYQNVTRNATMDESALAAGMMPGEIDVEANVTVEYLIEMP